MSSVYAEVEYHEGQQDEADGEEGECYSSPEADVVLQPFDVLGVVLFQFGQLGDVLAFVIRKLLPERGYVGFRLGGSQLRCGKLQISGSQLIADIGGRCGAGVIQRRQAHTVAADGQQGVVDMRHCRPFEIFDHIGEILVDGGLADDPVGGFIDGMVGDLADSLQLLVEGADGTDITKGSEAGAVTGATQIITSEAIPVSWQHIGRFRGYILR